MTVPSALMSVLRQIIRGCRNLPHVGPHPGTVPLILFLGMGLAAGVGRGLLPSVIGGLLMLTVFGPMFLIGAYTRARLSDHLEKKRQ
jgi:hypothetical protein